MSSVHELRNLGGDEWGDCSELEEDNQMNEDTCRKAFLEVVDRGAIGIHIKCVQFANSICKMNENQEKWQMAYSFFAAWNLKPKLSKEEIGKIINDMLYYNEPINNIAQAIYDKQEAKE